MSYYRIFRIKLRVKRWHQMPVEHAWQLIGKPLIEADEADQRWLQERGARHPTLSFTYSRARTPKYVKRDFHKSDWWV